MNPLPRDWPDFPGRGVTLRNCPGCGHAYVGSPDRPRCRECEEKPHPVQRLPWYRRLWTYLVIGLTNPGPPER